MLNTNNTGQWSEDRQELKDTVKMIIKWQAAVREVISVHGYRLVAGNSDAEHTWQIQTNRKSKEA